MKAKWGYLGKVYLLFCGGSYYIESIQRFSNSDSLIFLLLSIVKFNNDLSGIKWRALIFKNPLTLYFRHFHAREDFKEI